MKKTVRLHGLPGVKRKFLTAAHATSVSEAMCCLAPSGRAVEGCGDLGAIVAWIDDAGNYRAEFMRRRTVVAEGVFTTRKALRSWLSERWRKMDSEA